VALAPGESKQVAFPLGFDELSFFDNSGHAGIEPIGYTVWIRSDSLASSEAHFHIPPQTAATAYWVSIRALSFSRSASDIWNASRR
jgi:Fibronectin type III-like domain